MLRDWSLINVNDNYDNIYTRAIYTTQLKF